MISQQRNIVWLRLPDGTQKDIDLSQYETVEEIADATGCTVDEAHRAINVRIGEKVGKKLLQQGWFSATRDMKNHKKRIYRMKRYPEFYEDVTDESTEDDESK